MKAAGPDAVPPEEPTLASSVLRRWPPLLLLALASTACAQKPRTPAQSPALPALPALPDRQIVRGELGRRLDGWLTRMAAFGMHGALLVEQDGQIILHKGYGQADTRAGRRITCRTRFEVGSLGKQFTAAAVAEMVRRGRLTWQSELGQLLAGVPRDKQRITVHQLLTHTAGLPYSQGSQQPLLGTALVFAPGSGHRYSNVGYALLGQIVTKTSARSLEAVCRDLFVRAGVPKIGFTGQPMDWDDQAHGYVDKHDWGIPEKMTLDARQRGAGGYACTVGELYRWIHVLEGGTLLPKNIVQRLFTDHVSPKEPRTGYGYGWFVIETMRGTPLVRHMGTYNGFNSELRRYKAEKRTIVFLSNLFVTGRAMRDAVVNRVALIAAGRAVPEPPRVHALERRTAGRCSGTYRSADGVTLHVAASGAHLQVRAEDQKGIDLLFGSTGDRAAGLVADCNDRSQKLLAALRKNDRKAAQPLLNPGWVKSYENMRRAVADLTRFDIVGTAVIDVAAGSAATTLRLHGDSGARLVRFNWTRRGALGCPTVDASPSRRFLPVGAKKFAAFDLFSGKEVRFRFDLPARDAPARKLSTSLGGKPIQARRVG